MAPTPKAIRRTIALSALMLVAAGSWLGWQEAAPFLQGGATAGQRFAALSSGTHAPGPSIASRRQFLSDCLEAMDGFFAVGQFPEDRAAVAQYCGTVAERIAKQSPTDALAWLVYARSRAEASDIVEMNSALLTSQRVSQNEQWIAELRVRLAEAQFAELSAEVAARHAADLALLVRSTRGIAAIAGRYVSVPAFRERIIAIVETLPEMDQQRFLNRVREATALAATP